MDTCDFSSLNEVRVNIDKLDKEIVLLLCRRGEFVKQAARYKKDVSDVRDSKRLEQIIEKLTAYAKDLNFDPFIIEIIYRSMIETFIILEEITYTDLKKPEVL